MIKLGLSQKLTNIEKVSEGIAMIERRTGKSVHEHLNFGYLSNRGLKHRVDDCGDVWIGELNAENKIDGKGIHIHHTSGRFRIGRWDKGYDW